MLEAVVKSLGTVLEPEDLKRVREAYAIAADYVGVHASEFSHVQPRRLRTKLAHLVIRLACDGESDPQILSEQALSGLRGQTLSAAVEPVTGERKPA
jgi:hypothetical protein